MQTHHVVTVETQLTDILPDLFFIRQFRGNGTASAECVQSIGGREEADRNAGAFFKFQPSAFSGDDPPEFSRPVRRIQKRTVQCASESASIP